MTIEQLQKEYFIKKELLKKRINQFKQFYQEPFIWTFENNNLQLKPTSKDDNERIFEELCFCLLTANTSAELGLTTIDKVRYYLLNTTEQELALKLKDAKYRFYNRRAHFIVEAREFLKNNHNFELKKMIESIRNPEKRREFFIKNIKGLGYKESSHFLRNIGFKGYAILDKHIIDTLCEHDLCENRTPKNRNEYLEIEKDMNDFAENINIDFDELDLLIWSMKTNKILK